ncbi:MAG: hypothetical protein ACXWQR_05875 [Ktedonobacterales bacterium]
MPVVGTGVVVAIGAGEWVGVGLAIRGAVAHAATMASMSSRVAARGGAHPSAQARPTPQGITAHPPFFSGPNARGHVDGPSTFETLPAPYAAFHQFGVSPASHFRAMASQNGHSEHARVLGCYPLFKSFGSHYLSLYYV